MDVVIWVIILVVVVSPSMGEMDCTGKRRQNWLVVLILDRRKLTKIDGRSGGEMKMACRGFNLMPVVIGCKRILELL